jgi:F0F1-type ATP synthase membrane subunit c/vacuolar-type H+-ATPase subunit K
MQLAMHLHHLLYVAAGSSTVTTIHVQWIGALTYGLAAIGPGIGIGLIFAARSSRSRASRRPLAGSRA